MKTLSLLTAATSAIMLITFNAAACDMYNLDFQARRLNTPEYNATCGTASASAWTVTNSTCILTTQPIELGGDPGSTATVTTPLTITVQNPGATKGCDDYVLIQYQIDNGTWVTQDSVNTCDMDATQFSYSFNVTCGDTSAITVRIVMSVTDLEGGENSEKLRMDDGGICVSTPTILPIELIYFKGVLDNESVKLTWATASEKNNDYFTIERSTDGQTFDPIATVDGAGNSVQMLSYASDDNTPEAGLNYYRLKQTDFDGKFAYSNLVSVDRGDGFTKGMKIYPNPCNTGDELNVDISGCKDKEVLVVLYDANGKEVFSKVILQENEAGKTITAIDPSKKLNPGIYLVVSTSKNDLYNQKLIIK